MQNEMINRQAGTPALRTLPEIEADILAQKRTIGMSIVCIGNALIEAKAQLGHGQWGKWLRERAELSQSSAENYMRIAREIGVDSPLASLPYSKILPLLELPSGEREQFAEENDVDSKSAAKIRELIRAAAEEKKRADQLQAKVDVQEQMRRVAEKGREELREMYLKERDKKQEVEIREVAPADYEQTKAAYAELNGALSAANARAEQAERELIEMEERAREAEAEAQRVQMARIDAEEDREPDDPLQISNFAHACVEFTGRLYAAPVSATYFAMASFEDRRRYELMVQTIRSWVEGTEKALSEAFGLGCDGGADYVVR